MSLVSLSALTVLLVTISAICSGLNLSLMSLDYSDLRRKAKSGNRLAKTVLPLRRNSHLSLAAILIGNVGVISITSLVLDERFGGIIAGSVSTLLIVIFGEIIPQAIFLKNALKITAFFTPFTKILIILTYPISKPLQLLLDKMFGRHRAHLHTREELGMIIGEHEDSKHSELDDDEVEIIKGALELSEKKVQQITTPIKSVYSMSPTTVIDSVKIDEIKQQNYSRIPIFNKAKTEAYGLLLMKSLVDIDFDKQSHRVAELPLIKLPVIGSQTALDTLFRKFIVAKTHLMAVEKDDKFIGIVTIEDLIEEIIGHEIEDESDKESDRENNLFY